MLEDVKKPEGRLRIAEKLLDAQMDRVRIGTDKERRLGRLLSSTTREIQRAYDLLVGIARMAEKSQKKKKGESRDSRSPRRAGARHSVS